MTNKAQRYVENFVNEFGDVIKPGDEVYAITVSTSCTAVRKAKYIGFTQGTDNFNRKTIKRVQIEVDAKRSFWYFTDTGERTTFYESYYKQKNRKAAVGYEPYKRITTLQRNRIIPANVTSDKLAAAI